MLTYVLSADGSPLMPTYNIKKVRQMLKKGMYLSGKSIMTYTLVM